MIIVTWRFSTAPGKLNQGLEWEKGNQPILKKEGFEPQKKWLLRPRTGDTNRFVVSAQFTSFAAYGEFLAKGAASTAWQDRIKEINESDWYAGTEVTISELIEEH